MYFNGRLILKKQKAKAEVDDKFILLYFSGTGWCQSCIQLDRNILDTDSFSLFASEEFIPVKLDYPKLKRKKYAKKTQFDLAQLAERFNPNGIFPLLVFLDQNEDMIGFTGNQEITPQAYISIIQNIIHR